MKAKNEAVGDRHTAAKAAHTPGPWYVEQGNKFSVFCGKEGGGIQIARTDVSMANVADIQNQLANARLIAAGPDLLEGAKWALAMLEAKNGACHEDGPTICEACALRAAIAKAEGR